VTPSSNRLRRYQTQTLALLVLGYSGYYLCRSNFSVTLPLILRELADAGMDADVARVRLGTVASIGVFAYAIGKFLSGGLTDLLGGRRNFLFGMVASASFTVLFALGGGFPIFTLAWILNRLVQSLGWVGIVKMTSRWFSFSTYGTAMGVISLSFLFGDALARTCMSRLLVAGFGWRQIFFIAAAILFVIFLVNLLLLRESPRDVGEPEPRADPGNLFGRAADDAPANLKSLLPPLLNSRAFWYICLLSLGFTLLRETFNTWTPTYFTDAAGLTPAQAAESSALFPLLGGFSVLLAGWVSDRLGRSGRAAIILIGLIGTAALLVALGWSPTVSSASSVVALVALTGFVMIGPYSYLAGALALDLGGKRGSATAAGIIDGVGYLGGVLAGDSFARISVAYGWSGAFSILAAVALLSSLPAGLLLLEEKRR
jgi:OPA family glycerol-3-phosphate transporter-like MFS transporter